MPGSDTEWLMVIGKALAYLCVQEASKTDKHLPDIPSRVKFLEGIGLSTQDAAQLLGTTANSVRTNMRQKGKKQGDKRGKKAK